MKKLFQLSDMLIEQNQSKINEDPKDALLREYESEISELKKMLQSMQTSGATGT
jgi:hypothetical protein